MFHLPGSPGLAIPETGHLVETSAKKDEKNGRNRYALEQSTEKFEVDQPSFPQVSDQLKDLELNIRDDDSEIDVIEPVKIIMRTHNSKQ